MMVYGPETHMLTNSSLARAATPLHPLNAEKLVEQTVSALREEILSGHYTSGQTLPSQGAMSAELGVSRSVVREAMRTLQSQGLVTVSQGKRPSVLPAGPSAVIETLGTLVARSGVSLMQLLEVRRPLEIEIAALAAKRRNASQLQRMQESIQELEHAESIEAGTAADVQFHKVLGEASDNPLFGIVLDVFATLLRDSRRHTIQQSGKSTAIHHHRQILAAVADGDATAARDRMIAHMVQTEKDIRSSSQDGSVGTD